MSFMTTSRCGRRDAPRTEEGYSEFATMTRPRMTRAAALGSLPHRRVRLFLTARNGVEPDTAQRKAIRLRRRRTDGHRRADDIERGGGDGGGALVDSPRIENLVFSIEHGTMRARRFGREPMMSPPVASSRS